MDKGKRGGCPGPTRGWWWMHREYNVYGG